MHLVIVSEIIIVLINYTYIHYIYIHFSYFVLYLSTYHKFQLQVKQQERKNLLQHHLFLFNCSRKRSL